MPDETTPPSGDAPRSPAEEADLEEERHRMTLEALKDVDAGRTIDHDAMPAWADSLDAGANVDVDVDVEELLAIARHVAAHPRRPYVDHAELLYDENGLPK